MNIIAWILFGMIVGMHVNVIDPSPTRGGFLGSITLGIVGALLGGFVANIMLGSTLTRFSISSFCIAVACSLLLLFFGKRMLKA